LLQDAVEFWLDSIRNMALFTRLNICAVVILLIVLTGCAHHSVSLRPPIPFDLPATCVVQHEEDLSTIEKRFYGTDSFLTTHVLWHANPHIRNRGWVNAGETLTIPVLPDQDAPFSPGDTIHVCSSPLIIADPPYGFDVVISKDGSALLPYGVELEVVGLTPKQVTTAIERAYVPKIFVKLDLVALRMEKGAAPNRGSVVPSRDADDSETGHEP
jgi:hypothetical protein